MNGNGQRERRSSGDRGGGRGLRRRRRGAARRGALSRGGSRRDPALPVPAPDRVGQDDRRGRVRRGGADDGRPHPHAPSSARLAVQPRARGRGLRRPADPDRRAGRRPRRSRARSRSRPTPGSRGTTASSAATTYQLVIADEAHTALGEKTSLAIRSFPDPIYIGMTATEQLIAKQVSDVFPASVDDLPLQDAARRGLIAPLRNLRVPPAAAIHSVPIVGGDFEERALAAVLDHTALNQAAASLYRDRFDSTPGIVYAAGVDHAYNLAQEFRAAGLKAEAVSGRDAAGQARRDPRRLRARRDRHPDQRDAARRGLELAARDGRHAPRADREPARLPAAHRPDHAHAPAQGGRDRRRLREQGRDAQRPRGLAAQPARRRLLPRGRPRHARAAPPAEPPRATQALARAVARAGDARRPPPPRGHPTRVAANRSALPRRGRAALLGLDRRPPGALRGARRLRRRSFPTARRARPASSSSSPRQRRRTRTAGCG